MSASTASHAIDELEEEGLVKVEKKVTKQVQAANNQLFRDYKRAYNLQQLLTTNVIDELERACRPDAIVLFGSYARAEDDNESDIDLALVNSHGQVPELETWEQELKRSINPQPVRLNEIGNNFRSTLANGIVLRGYLDL